MIVTDVRIISVNSVNLITSASIIIYYTDLVIRGGEQTWQSPATADCGLALYSNEYSLLAISWMLRFFLHSEYNIPHCPDQSTAQHSITVLAADYIKTHYYFRKQPYW